MAWEPSIVVAVFGLLIGSFLNVVIARMPRHESLNGRSHCPKCGHQIAWYDNIPVLSWLVLRARCRSCKAPISVRYPAVELATALLWLAAARADSSHLVVAEGLVLMTLLVPIWWIDIDHRIIPNRLTYPGSLVGLALSIAHDPHRWWVPVVSALAGGCFFFVPWLLFPAGMGLGDVKMAFMLGAFLGPRVGVAIVGALLSSIVIAIAVFAKKGVAAGRKTKVPFGPFLCIGGVAAWFWGHPLLHAYLHSLHR